ncbi:hypothetical protein ACUL41_05170 [Virgibacillus natechei]
MKKSLLVTIATLALTLCISTSSFASTNNSEELKPFDYNDVMETYYSSFPDKVKSINSNVEANNDKKYLTDEEVRNRISDRCGTATSFICVIPI